jgi:integrase
MAVFAWRQFNVRLCNLGMTKDSANIFKGGFDPNRSIGKPDDVEEELARNPGAEFWQIFFPKDQVKTKQVVRGIVPLYLVPLLEDYITNQRPLLIRAALISTADRGTLFVDRGTLFLNRRGNPYSSNTFGSLIGGLTMKNAGRWGHPHLYRDALAYRWLDTHPEDYLSLSKHLWHRNINTTIRRYGRNFDESHGLKKVGGWVGTLFTS